MKHNLTPENQKRIVTEFAALEEQLDQVLFARRDDDEDEDGHPILQGAAIGTAVGGTGVGTEALRRYGRTANRNAFVGPSLPDMPAGSKGVLGDIAAGGKLAAKEGSESLQALFKRLFGRVRV
jgi:hypothetical protein